MAEDNGSKKGVQCSDLACNITVGKRDGHYPHWPLSPMGRTRIEGAERFASLCRVAEVVLRLNRVRNME